MPDLSTRYDGGWSDVLAALDRVSDPVSADLADYDTRLADDHGVPAVLRGVPEGYYQRGTLVRIAEPGNYYLHLVQAADGRVWAGFTRSASSSSVVSEEELAGEVESGA